MTDPAQVRMDERAARWADERAHSATINWNLINALHTKPHPLLNIGDDCQFTCTTHDDHHYIGEIEQEARTAHHLLDMAGIPPGTGYSSDVDARTYLAVKELGDLRERLARIARWHARETGPAGTVGDYCTECGTRWPCDTQRMAEGTYTDNESADACGTDCDPATCAHMYDEHFPGERAP